MHKEDELKTWRLATVILVLLAAFVFSVEHFVFGFLDITLEIFLFYVPAISIVVLYIYFRFRQRP